MLEAKPNDIERFSVVGMMRFGFRIAALTTGKTDKSAIPHCVANRHVGVIFLRMRGSVDPLRAHPLCAPLRGLVPEPVIGALVFVPLPVARPYVRLRAFLAFAEKAVCHS
jgi:hypothetical protein